MHQIRNHETQRRYVIREASIIAHRHADTQTIAGLRVRVKTQLRLRTRLYSRMYATLSSPPPSMLRILSLLVSAVSDHKEQTYAVTIVTLSSAVKKATSPAPTIKFVPLLFARWRQRVLLATPANIMT